MATPTLSTTPNATWAACVSTVLWWSAAVAATVAVLGGLADNWRELMAMLSLGFWSNAICAGLSVAVAAVALCHVHGRVTDPLTEKKVLRASIRPLVLAVALAFVALLFTFAQPAATRSTTTSVLACGAMWISSVGACFWSVVGLGFGVWPESK